MVSFSVWVRKWLCRTGSAACLPWGNSQLAALPLVVVGTMGQDRQQEARKSCRSFLLWQMSFATPLMHLQVLLLIVRHGRLGSSRCKLPESPRLGPRVSGFSTLSSQRISARRFHFPMQQPDLSASFLPISL